MYSALFPPNSQQLSNVAIAAVMQRSVPRDGEDYVQSDSRRISLREATVTDGQENTALGHQGTTKRTGNKRRQSSVDPSAMPSALLHGHEDLWKELATTLAQAEAIHRERSRRNMARYRERQRNKLTSLQKDIRGLQDDIRQLEWRQQQIVRGVSMTNTPWCVAAEYFRLFRYGYKARTVQHESQVQLDFLRAAMARDVVLGSRRGVEAMVESWEFVMRCCQNFELRLGRLEHRVDGIVTAFCTAAFTYSENTLRYAFKHLLDDKDGTALAVKLLGRRLQVRVRMEFCWDDEANRVQMLVVRLDVVAALLKLLGNLGNVSCVMEKMLMEL